MDLKTLAVRAGLTQISVDEAARILKNRGGAFDIRMRLRKGEADYGYAEKQPNGKYKYIVFKELLKGVTE